jgi:hypothetical protein
MLTIFIAAAAMAAPAVPAQAQTCDRACLRTTLDQYLAAVVKHEPSAAPLATGYRHTENAINKKLGDGVWKSVTGPTSPGCSSRISIKVGFLVRRTPSPEAAR